MLRSLSRVLLILVLGAALGGLAPWAHADPPAAGEQGVEGPRDAGAEDRSPQYAGARDGNNDAPVMMLLAVLLGFSAFALLTLTVVIAPEHTAELIVQAPGTFLRRFLIGTANVVFIFVAIKISRNLLAIPMVPFVVVLFVLGLLVLCEETGRRLQRVAGREWNRLTRMGAGWAVLYFAAWFPLIGWFVVAPVLVLTAIGTTMLWLLSKRSKPTATASAAPEAEPKPAGSDMPAGV